MLYLGWEHLKNIFKSNFECKTQKSNEISYSESIFYHKKLMKQLKE